MTRRAGWLVTLLLLAIAAVIVFYVVGGSVDIDADVRNPRVDVDPGRLPDVDVNEANDAEAGDPQ
jgi:hypothetical protein